MKLNSLNNIGIQSTDKVLLISDYDLDGIVGGCIIKIYFPQVVWYHTRKKNLINELIDSGEIYDYDYMFMLDLSPDTITDLETLINIFGIDKLFIIDHHKSFIELLNKHNMQDSFNVSINYSSALNIALLTDDDRIYKSNIVKLTDIYDMWRKDNITFEEAKILNKKLMFLGIESFIIRTISLLKGDIKDLLLTDEERNRFLLLNKEVNQYIKHKIDIAYIKKDEAITFAERYKSEIGNGILDKYKDVRIAMVVDIANNTISVRAKQNSSALDKLKDISCINYGGHELAAGAYVDYKSMIYDLLFKSKEII